MTIRYLDAVTLLHSNGHPHLASAAIAHYERLASGMSAEHRCLVSVMFDEVLETALNRREEITSVDILLSPDFATIRALAHLLQDLKLVDSRFAGEVKPPPAPPEAFDDVEFVEDDELL